MMDTTFAAKSCVSSAVNSSLVLILDGSGSIQAQNFPKLKAFAVEVVKQLPINEVVFIWRGLLCMYSSDFSLSVINVLFCSS